ncbi:MAG: GatB/YqeY domain-containing protein [Gammaproteobacteria bacterium]|nr:MAG: GatB/YqeY domain-containing protein [Gammaproteobacteria bacterium]TDJ45860.1 MAG: GatB/YqeY domain-containing protein [Gammaproteobacteria bacterium]
MPPSTTLKAHLQDDVKSALRAGDKARLSILRLAMAAIQRSEIDARDTLTDAAVVNVLRKMVQQCQESIGQYRQGNRDDLVAKEIAEIAVLQEYLPAPLDEAETLALVEEVLAATAANSRADMGRVMAEIKTRAAGKVDMAQVSALVRVRLGER